MANPSKQKGTAAETALLRWLHANGHKDAVRNPPGGSKDVGDLTCSIDVWWDDGFGGGYMTDRPCVIEVKNHANLATAINDGLTELDAEMTNAGTDHGVLVCKRRGRGEPGEWLAIRLVKNDPEIGAP